MRWEVRNCCLQRLQMPRDAMLHYSVKTKCFKLHFPLSDIPPSVHLSILSALIGSGERNMGMKLRRSSSSSSSSPSLSKQCNMPGPAAPAQPRVAARRANSIGGLITRTNNG